MQVFNAWQATQASSSSETTIIEPTDSSVSGEVRVKTLNVEKSIYYRGEEILFFGAVDGYNSDSIVTIVISNPGNGFVALRSAIPDEEGNFEAKYPVNSKFRIVGTYSATASADDPNRGIYTTFDFSSGAPPLPPVTTTPVESTLSEQVTISEPTTPKPKSMPSFVDPEKDPHYYIDRYNNEVIYKEWFDENYPNYTIKEAVGIPESIPGWIKDNAKGWADGQTGESEFVSGIEYMVKEKIIYISDLPSQASTTAKAVPDWIKNNAGWWADGQIDEDEFVNGIKYLVKKGIIRVDI